MADRSTTTSVGHSIARLEGRDKVTGRTDYIYNLRLPSMLHAKACRSPISHGRIRAIDTGAALAMPGVRHVVTGEDVKAVLPEPYYGPAFHDQPILALDKVRHFGEPVAVVLADDPHIAESAAQIIEVDYQELPGVYDEIEALRGQIIVHEELKPAGTFADLKHLAGRRDTNLALDYHLRHGDTDRAFAQAEHVFDHIFSTQQTMHAAFEPIVAVGPRAALPHARPGATRIGEAGFVLFDWGARTTGGYRSDLTRVLVTRKIPPKLEKIYGVVLNAQRQGIKAIRPGATLESVDRAARRVIENAGFSRFFGHGLGHGIGLDIHEEPRLSPVAQGVLEPGMVITVEPGIYLPGWGGVRIEDDVLVTRDGHEVLTSVPKRFEDAAVRID